MLRTTYRSHFRGPSITFGRWLASDPIANLLSHEPACAWCTCGNAVFLFINRCWVPAVLRHRQDGDTSCDLRAGQSRLDVIAAAAYARCSYLTWINPVWNEETCYIDRLGWFWTSGYLVWLAWEKDCEMPAIHYSGAAGNGWWPWSGVVACRFSPRHFAFSFIVLWFWYLVATVEMAVLKSEIRFR